MEVSRLVCFCVLAGASAADICFRKIPVKLLLAMNAAAVFYQLAVKEISMILVAGGIGVGIFSLAMSKFTGEGIGYGDSLCMLSLGIYLGLWNVLEVLAITFFILTVGAVFLLLQKKMSRKCTLPFFPFLTAGYLLWFIGETGL